MRKYFLIFILMYGQLFALERESTLKIYYDIFSALSLKTPITVYTTDKEYRKVFSASKRIFLSSKIDESDIVLVTSRSTLQTVLNRINVDTNIKKPILFVTDYHFLKYSDEIVGAFYWRKGRSQLLFVKKRLEKQNITLPREYQKYMVDAL